MKYRILSVIALAGVVTACNDIKTTAENLSDKSTAFAAVNTSLTGEGTTRPRVLELMGTPIKIDTDAVVGVTHEVLDFTDSRGLYRVRLINNRAVSKSATPNQTTSTIK
jgi:hypothetical protein